MRSTVIAALPRNFCWQAASTKAYAAQSPVIWHHRFVSDIPMTNWAEGCSHTFTWVAKTEPHLASG
jgi:hypothetical protein